MAANVTLGSAAGNSVQAEPHRGEGAHIAELYSKAKNNLQLLLIYKKIVIAAEVGDWSLMNELYREFRMTEASMN